MDSEGPASPCRRPCARSQTPDPTAETRNVVPRPRRRPHFRSLSMAWFCRLSKISLTGKGFHRPGNRFSSFGTHRPGSSFPICCTTSPSAATGAALLRARPGDPKWGTALDFATGWFNRSEYRSSAAAQQESLG